MKRRLLVTFLIGAGLACRDAAAQSARRLARIGVLFGDPRYMNDEWSAVVSDLARRGHVAGKTVVFETRIALGANPVQLASLAGELARMEPDVIVAAGGSAAALAAKGASKSVPIVFLGSADPVAMGLVASLARPGGNVTGNSSQNFDAYGKGLELLAQVAGGLKRVVAIDPKGEHLTSYFPKYAAALIASATALGATIQFVEYESVDALDALVKRLAQQGMDAAFLGDGPLNDALVDRRIADIFVENRVPTVGNAREGMLLQYTASWKDRAHSTAEYVDRILRGASPAELPVRQPTKFEFILNMKTAKSLGLSVPKSILLRADEVIR